MPELDVDQLLMQAEAKWSLGDDDEAAAALEESLAAVWGRPEEVARVSELATRLAEARPSEPLSRVARRAAAGADALHAYRIDKASTDERDDWTRPTRRRKLLGRIQLAFFTVVVIAVLAVRYLEAAR